MSFQLLGQVIGASFGPFGAIAGSLIGGEIDRAIAPGPDPGDLAAPSIGLGTRLPRVYGTVRVPLHPVSWSAYRATEEGGKGSQPTGFSYSLDMLGAVADGTNVQAVTRVWVNKKLSDTRHASSGLLALARAVVSPEWCTSWTLFPGGPAQTPPPLYEDRVGTANAPAQRGYATIEIADLKCGGAKAPPAIEVELATAGTWGTLANILLDAPFDASYDDTKAPVCSTTLTNSARLSLSGGALVMTPSGSTGGAVSWTEPVAPDDKFHDLPAGGTTTIYCQATYTSTTGSGTGDSHRIIEVVGVGFDNAGLQWRMVGGVVKLRVSINYSGGGTYGSEASVPAAGTEFGNDEYRIVYDRALNQIRFYCADTLLDTVSSSLGTFIGNIALLSSAVPTVDCVRGATVQRVLVYNGDFPVDVDTFAPAEVTLSSIILAELGLDETFDPADVDVTAIADIMVTGYVAAGDANTTVAELCSMFFVDVVPGTPIKFVKRGLASVVTIANADTGVAVGQPGQRFAGLKRENADETPAIAAVRFPLLERDHEAGYERGDRNSAESDDERRIDTRVVMSAAQAKGRALAFTLLDRVRRHKAAFALSDKYAALEPGDACSVVDNDGNTARLNARRMSYADGVKQIEWELDDVTALVQTGLTSSDYTPAYDPAAPADVTLLLLDIPILRDADNSYGLYACCTATGDWQGADVYKSTDGLTYTRVERIAHRATAGLTSGALGAFTGWTWDDTNTLTVTLDAGSGSTLATATKAAIEADATLNVAAIGAHGRWEIVRFASAAFVSGTTYLLSGLLRGQAGTEAFNGTHVAGDTFVLLQASGMLRVPGSLGDVGAVRYFKAVAAGRQVANATAQTLVTAEVGLQPYAPVDLRLDSGGALVWDRRTRLESRFLFGTEPPLGEASEAYDVQVLASGTEVASGTVSTASYTSAELTAGRTVRVWQRSAAIGRGSKAESTL